METQVEIIGAPFTLIKCSDHQNWSCYLLVKWLHYVANVKASMALPLLSKPDLILALSYWSSMCRPLLAVLVNCSTHKLILPTLWSESSIQIRAANLSADILVTQWFLGSVLALLLYWLCLFSRKSPVAFWQSSLRWLEKLESTLHFWHITILSKNVVHCTNYISPEVVWPRGVLLTRLMLSHCASVHSSCH